MIAEPYICKHDVISTNCGEIKWFSTEDAKRLDSSIWQPYADFEREKLRKLGCGRVHSADHGYYFWTNQMPFREYTSVNLIGYDWDDYFADDESSRLLKRAEFLKAVCEKEGVEWLPQPIRTPMMQACDKFPKDNAPSPEGEEKPRLKRNPCPNNHCNAYKTCCGNCPCVPCDHDTNDEREWRKELLDFEEWRLTHPNWNNECLQKIEDLRKRFL